MTEPIPNDGSDLSILQQLETEEVVFESGGRGQMFIMTSLVPADIAETRKRVARKQVDEDAQELFLCFLALRKYHKGLKWAEFKQINVASQMKFIACMYRMNGMDEVFRTINPTAKGAQSASGTDSIGPIDDDDSDDFTDI